MPELHEDTLAPNYVGDYKTKKTDALVNPDYLFNATSDEDGQMSSEDKTFIETLKQGTGGSDVTPQAFAAEVAARKSGDDTQFSIVTSAQDIQDSIDETRTQPYALLVRSATVTITHDGTQYRHGQLLFLAPSPNNTIEAGPVIVEPNGLNPRIMRPTTGAQVSAELVLQRNRDRPLWILPQASLAVVVDASGFNVHDGDVIYVAPFSDVVHTITNTRDISGDIGIEPNRISAIGDLDGTYRLAVYNLNVDYLTARRVTQYEVWVGQRAVHTVSSWTPTANFLVDFTISTSEETTIGLKSGDTIVPVQWVPRLPSGAAENSMIRTTYLHIGGAGLTPEQSADLGRIPLIPPFSDIQVEPPGLPDGNLPERFTFLFGDKQTSEAIRQVRVTQGDGTVVHTEAGDVKSGATIVAELSADERRRWENNIDLTDTSIDFSLYIDYVDTSVPTFRKRWPEYPVHNSDFATGGAAAGATAAQVAQIEANEAAVRISSEIATEAHTQAQTNAKAIETLKIHSGEPEKQLLGRAVAATDFRGTYTRWRGAVADRAAMLALSGAADGDIVYRIDLNNFHARSGGGWSPIAANHAPASWRYYATFAEAQATEIRTHRVVIWATGSLFSLVNTQAHVLRHVELPDEATYDALVNRDENTLYWVPE